MQVDVWTYRENLPVETIIDGFGVEALDGSIGKVDRASTEVGWGHIVVDTGPWIFGKRVLLPAGVIDRVDLENEKVYVNRTKDEIKHAPEFDESFLGDDGYRDRVGAYYGRSEARGFDEPLVP